MPKLRFTKKSILAAKCEMGKKRTVYSDQTTAGLILETRATGGKTFYVRFTDRYGSQRNYKIGDATSVNLKTARQITIDVKSKVAAGEDPFEQKKRKKSALTLNAFYENHYLPFAKTNKKSWKFDVVVYKKHIAPSLGSKRVDVVKTTDILFIHGGMKEKGYAAGTCNRALILVQHMFNMMMRWEIGNINENPCAKVKLFKVDNKHQRFLTKEEICRLQGALKQSTHPFIYFIVNFMLLTGARKQEALRAAWKDIDFENRFWLIPETKSGKPRPLPISDKLMVLLHQLPSRRKSVWLFPNPNTDKPYVSTFYPWNTARKKAGLPDVRMHDLRHTFASFLVNSGRSLYEVQKLLGHANIATTERYAHLDNATLTKAVNTAGAFVDLDINEPAKPLNIISTKSRFNIHNEFANIREIAD